MAKRKDPAAVALGRKGGKARLKKMTPEERSRVSREAANVRWGKATNAVALTEGDQRLVEAFAAEIDGREFPGENNKGTWVAKVEDAKPDQGPDLFYIRIKFKLKSGNRVRYYTAQLSRAAFLVEKNRDFSWIMIQIRQWLQTA